MNLVVDQGNTVCKVAICDEKRVIKSYSLPKFSLLDAKHIIEKNEGIDSIIYSSVGAYKKTLYRFLSDKSSTHICLGPDTPVPLEVQYNRENIGSDRLAAAVASHHLAKGSEVLVVDSGTAITFERITANGIYLGGNISPGIDTRLKSLHHFTSRLPLVSSIETNGDIGTNTKDAITLGVMKGIYFEIDGYIDELKKTHPDAIVIVTGGYSHCMKNKLRNKVYIIPNLVLMGLNLILEYNKKHMLI